jgi:type IV pilus assembly protein PilC
MEFQYSAKSTNGSTSTGVLVAESIAEARQRLREKGLFALSLESAGIATGPFAGRFKRKKKRVGKSDLLMLTSQLSIMTQAGVDLAEALEGVGENCIHPTLKAVLAEIHNDVSSGAGISESLRKHVDVFGEAYVASIAAGEASGTLTDVLDRLVELLGHELKLQSSIKSVLAYPIVLSVVAFNVIGALVFFVLPQFGSVFEDMGKTPPIHTQILLDVSAFLRAHFLKVGVTFSVFVLLLYKFWLADRAGKYWDGFVLNFRLARGATRSLYTGRTFRLLGTMLESGIPLLDGIRLCRASVKNRLYRELFDQLEDSVLNGRGIGTVLTATPFVPPGASQMVGTAERTGRIGPVMVTIGEFYENEGEQKVRDLTKLLEPLIIVVMGVVVSVVVLAVMLPLLDVSTGSH